MSSNDSTYIDMGMYEVDGEKVYVIHEPKYGEVEFTSIEALDAYVLNPNNDAWLTGYRWVTDNEPVEIDSIDWVDPEPFTDYCTGRINLLTSYRRKTLKSRFMNSILKHATP